MKENAVRFIPVDEGATRSGLSVKTLKRLGREGAVLIIRARTRLLIDVKSLDTWLAQQPTLASMK